MAPRIVFGTIFGRSLSGTPEMITNGDFHNGTSGWAGDGRVKDGSLCFSSAVDTYSSFHLVKNDVYTLKFRASASKGVDVLVQTPQLPLDPNLDTTAALTTSPYWFSFTFSPANEAGKAILTFANNVSGAKPAEVCLHEVSLKRIDRSSYVEDAGPSIKVNQVGYLPDGPKIATVVTNATKALRWQLRKGIKGKVLEEGDTLPRGVDKASGEAVHVLDFGSAAHQGQGFVLTAGNRHSLPFDILPTIYETLRQDSLAFFYHQRSGIEIEADLVGEEYARAAGHVGVAPNQGDTAVPCQAVRDSKIAYDEPWTCNYTLDVTKGWYDAGDQGKYVVNGGIAVYQLLSAYERTLHAKHVAKDALGDGSLRIPERHNGVPDILDESRWELEFMLGMQVPPDSPPQLIGGSMVDVSGMAHHKMHDNQWTALPTDPAQDPKRRELHRPGTAATLNLAATAAQGSRLFKDFDGDFAEKLLSAARTAYDAAKANPEIYASGNDWDLGGGPYSDDDVTDEFYWAAAELFLTTGEARFASDATASKWHTADVFAIGGFSWGSTAALGRLSLATVPSKLPDRDDVVASLMAGADKYLKLQESQAYGTLMTHYVWGSNSNQMNCIQVIASASDVSGNASYRQAALAGLDYVLGRNALAQSYITGYGKKYSHNQHSRLYAHELDVQSPNPPPGSLAGGANQDANDPPANDVLKGCAPQHCYVDDINSYSTNEITVNWNSGLAWVASWAADQGAMSSGVVLV